LPDGSLKNPAWQTVLVSEAASDPKTALARLLPLKLPWSANQDILNAIFARWTIANPADAAASVALLTVSGLKTTAVGIVARQWAETDVQAALAWAQSLPQSPPTTAPTIGLTQTFAGADRINSLTAILETWMNHDLDSALNWVSQLPDGPERVALVSRACSVNQSIRTILLSRNGSRKWCRRDHSAIK
jgi:hypothetical protein